ncbi:CRN-like protein [Plasmopara halstedii]|uniref:CRN-like protein n=1 Tax=Plasmopara halstedii TaxID=4781 RepID=A0A0P1B2A9_PLAHL|nr:CRN-like protein [Plasmopara halstedii]CEG48158.1 CRN-like protein [Plasmopara halstedii]|eukprot:XP_024584527.1 CRN-like protein [Plasmopara halstedii]
MLTLYCAVIGELGSAFEVKINDAESVSALKKAIKKEQEFDFAANKLELYLAKKDKGRGAWVTEEEARGLNGTSDLEILDVARAPLKFVGLSEEDVRFQVTKEDVKAKTTPVHVLVVVPGSAVDDGAWSAKEFSTVDPQVQLKMSGCGFNVDALVSADELAPLGRRHIH